MNAAVDQQAITSSETARPFGSTFQRDVDRASHELFTQTRSTSDHDWKHRKALFNRINHIVSNERARDEGRMDSIKPDEFELEVDSLQNDYASLVQMQREIAVGHLGAERKERLSASYRDEMAVVAQRLEALTGETYPPTEKQKTSVVLSEPKGRALASIDHTVSSLISNVSAANTGNMSSVVSILTSVKDKVGSELEVVAADSETRLREENDELAHLNKISKMLSEPTNFLYKPTFLTQSQGDSWRHHLRNVQSKINYRQAVLNKVVSIERMRETDPDALIAFDALVEVNKAISEWRFTFKTFCLPGTLKGDEKAQFRWPCWRVQNLENLAADESKGELSKFAKDLLEIKAVNEEKLRAVSLARGGVAAAPVVHLAESSTQEKGAEPVVQVARTRPVVWEQVPKKAVAIGLIVLSGLGIGLNRWNSVEKGAAQPEITAAVAAVQPMQNVSLKTSTVVANDTVSLTEPVVAAPVSAPNEAVTQAPNYEQELRAFIDAHKSELPRSLKEAATDVVQDGSVKKLVRLTNDIAAQRHGSFREYAGKITDLAVKAAAQNKVLGAVVNLANANNAFFKFNGKGGVERDVVGAIEAAKASDHAARDYKGRLFAYLTKIHSRYSL